MPDAKTTLLFCLGVVAASFAIFWLRAIFATARKGDASSPDGKIAPTPYQLFVGFVTDFFDTLGIGSFATTTAFFRLKKTVDDEQIPGTLNIGHTIPTFLQAYIYTQLVEVDAQTLILMILAAVFGSWIGAGTVARWSRRRIQVGMGTVLLLAAVIMLLQALEVVPGGNATKLEGTLLVIGIVGNFVLGALMTLGIGLYTPCLILVSLLGMSPIVAFPIMMGSCAFLMPVADVQFIRQRKYSLRAALGLTIAGTIAVWIAAHWVVKLDLAKVKWAVVVIVIYTAITLLRAAAREKRLAATH